MKKIGILTFHYVDNYGAVLQAWALRNFLNTYFNCHAEIINYVPDGYMIYPYKHTSYGIDMMKRKRKVYEDFLSEFCDINSSIIRTVTGNEYDYYCVGSDQVWNMSFRENSRNEYLFPNLNINAKRFSYAASIGGKIEEENKVLFKKYLSRFDSISVREKSSENELREMGFKNIETSLDPTLLLESDKFEKLMKRPKKPASDFILFFTYPIGEEVRQYTSFVNMLSRKYGLKIIHSLVDCEDYLLSNDGGTMMYEGIGEFLWYFKHAVVIVTSSYHCAIFGRVFNKPTFIIKRDEGWIRMEQLIDIFDLRNNVVENDWILHDWDIVNGYSGENNRLNAEREKSIVFLKRVLNE